MSARRFHPNQIHQILEEYEQGRSIQELIEEYHISKATFYNWRAKYGHSHSNKSEEMLNLIADYERLKRMFADLSLENVKLRTKLEQLSEK